MTNARLFLAILTAFIILALLAVFLARRSTYWKFFRWDAITGPLQIFIFLIGFITGIVALVDVFSGRGYLTIWSALSAIFLMFAFIVGIKKADIEYPIPDYSRQVIDRTLSITPGVEFKIPRKRRATNMFSYPLFRMAVYIFVCLLIVSIGVYVTIRPINLGKLDFLAAIILFLFIYFVIPAFRIHNLIQTGKRFLEPAPGTGDIDHIKKTVSDEVHRKKNMK